MGGVLIQRFHWAAHEPPNLYYRYMRVYGILSGLNDLSIASDLIVGVGDGSLLSVAVQITLCPVGHERTEIIL